MTTIHRLHDLEASDPRIAGGKGAGLASLAARGFAVPAAFVVGAGAYARFAGEIPAGEDPLARAEAARTALAERQLPEDVARDVEEALGALAGDTFAVRSSSTLEDLDQAAFAGQHDTFLHVGRAEVAARVRDCFLSLWSDRAVRYRLHRGFGLDEAAMAVVVQEMVDSRAAGVVFGLDPVSGAMDTMVVDANHGLGESVVAGDVSVDHYRLDRRTLAVIEERLGDKEYQLVRGASGVVRAPAPGPAACLTPAELAEIGRTAQRIEAHRGFRLDVEWAIDREGRLRVLQARPITAVPARWTRQESAERFPGPMTPLAWELAEAGFHESLRHSLQLMGFPAFAGKWFGLFDGYVYGNQNAVELILGAAVPPVATLADARALAAEAPIRYRWALDLPERWTTDLDRFLTRMGEIAGEDPRGVSPAGCWARILRIDEAGRDYFRPNIAISMGHGLLHRTLHALLGLSFDRAAAGQLYHALTRASDTKTGAVNHGLWALVQRVKAEPGLPEALLGEGGRALWEGGALEAGHPAFAAELGRFLSAHAHRETDADPYQPPWGDAPWVVLDTLRALLAAPDAPDAHAEARRTRADARRAEATVYAALPEDLHDLFAEVLRLARTYAALDDWEHYETTRLHLVFRRGLLALGGWLCERQVTVRPDDVFFARRDALEDWIAVDTPATRAALALTIARGRAEYEAASARTPSFTLGAPEPAAAPAGAGELRGIPGAPGMAAGEVFVVRSAADFSAFPRGAVLVAPSTNPAWTPLFYGAAAVVTESGGPLSHGAVTARELGLPAVMAVRGCTGRLRTGQRVRVDGARGVVSLLEA